MKTKNLLLLSLVSLALVGCDGTSGSNSASKSAAASDAPISNKTSTKTSTAPASTEKKDSAVSDNSANKDSETSSSTTTGGDVLSPSTSESASESSTSVDIYSTTLWPASVVDEMLLHLGNRIVPYVDLGKSASKLTAEWDSDTDTLTVMGGVITGGLTTTKLDDAKTTYETAGWTVTIKDSAFTAINADGDLTVKYYTEDDLCYFTAKYAETFDPTKASSWPTDLMSDMNTNMNNHGADIPFVYLGTVAPTGVYDQGKYTITGGAWDDQVTSLADTAFQAANASISDDANKWTITTGTNSYGTTFKANATLADGTVLKISIEAPYKSSYSTTKRYAKMEITYKEPFNPPSTGSWGSDIQDVFTTNFDGHTLPWFYTGCTPYLYNSTPTTATIYGTTESWDDQIYTLCQTAIDNENATITDEAYKWTVTSTTLSSGIVKYTYSRTYDDGCSLSFTIENFSTSQNKVEMHVTYSPKFVVPSTGDWEQEIKDMFTNDFGGHIIPWFYTGGTNSIYTHTSGSANATICGENNTWREQIINLAKTAFETENATITNDDNKWSLSIDSTYAYGNELDAVRTYEDGCKLTVAVRNFSSYYSKAEIKISYTPAFVIPTTGDWTTEVKQVFTDFDGHSIPWFYIGGNPTLKYYYTGDTYAYIDAPENSWDDQIFTLAQTAVDAENATITNDDEKWKTSLESGKLTCIRTFADDCTIKFTVTNYSTYYNYARVSIFYQKKLATPTTTAWDSTITDFFTTKCDNHAMPWFNTGCTPTVYSSTDTTMTIYGTSGTWNDKILDLAKAACEAENATITDDEYKWVATTTSISAGTKLTETRTYEDGCTLKFTVENFGTSSNKAEIHVTYTPSIVYPTGDDAKWSDTVTTALTTFLGASETLPWIYLNAAKDAVTTRSYTNELDLRGGNWDPKLITKAIDELNASNQGWTYINDTYSEQLIAIRQSAAGKPIKLVLKASGTTTLLEIYYK